jgi:hypothetical protein
VTEPNSIYGAVRAYLAGSASRYQRGEDEYYARLALEQAMLAGVAGNFGIGAVAVVREVRLRASTARGMPCSPA